MKKIVCFLFLFLLSILLLSNTIERYFEDSKIIDHVIAKTAQGETENFQIMKQMIEKATQKSNELFELLKKENSTTEKEEEKETKVDFEQDPTFYIYNTHQTEEYLSENIGSEKLKPTVLTAANLLKEELEKVGIKAVVEERSIKERLNEEKWPYDHSYRISREYMEDMKQKISSLNVFIDLHRDSLEQTITTTKIGGKSYAKLMFLVGKSNKNYQKNEKHIQKMESWFQKNYPSVLRNRFYRNYDYNQDFSDTTFLIELGSQHNTLEEISNTIELLATALSLWNQGKL